jgi:hypothetical protein
MAELKGKSDQPMQHRTDNEALPFGIEDYDHNMHDTFTQAETVDCRAQVEDVEDDKMPAVEPRLKHFAEQYPQPAGTPLHRGQTCFEELRV